MKVELHTFMHSSNGISLQVIAETEAESELLKGIWKHGKLDTGHPMNDKHGLGYFVSWNQRQETPK